MPRWVVFVCIVALAACGEDPTAGEPVCDSQLGVAVGTPVEGTLLDGDARFAGARIDYYALRLDTAAELTVQLSSAEIDPLLLVFDRSGDVAAQAFQAVDPGPDVVESPSLVRAFPAGCSLIGATAYDVDDTGAYTLTVEPAP